jgi:hypothetical protein
MKFRPDLGKDRFGLLKVPSVFHASAPGAGNCDGFTPEGRVVLLLDGSEKGVHVDVDDDSPPCLIIPGCGLESNQGKAVAQRKPLRVVVEAGKAESGYSIDSIDHYGSF